MKEIQALDWLGAVFTGREEIENGRNERMMAMSSADHPFGACFQATVGPNTVPIPSPDLSIGLQASIAAAPAARFILHSEFLGRR